MTCDVTEGDVLAFLVLNAALGELMMGVPRSEWQPYRDAIDNWEASPEWSRALQAVALERFCAHDRLHASAIADCERRYAVEKCEQEVLEAADIWGSRWSSDVDFRVANQRLEDAVRQLRAAREAL